MQWEQPIDNVITVHEHPNIVINPCTHHPLVIFREKTGMFSAPDDVHVVALDTMTGLTLEDTVIETGVKFEVNSKCGESECPSGEQICKCFGATTSACSASQDGGCMELAPRVHGATYRFSSLSDDTCLLYLAYDYSAIASDQETYMKSKLRIFFLDGDVPILGQEIKSSMDSVAQNDFNGTVIVDQFSGRVGFFYYRQIDGNACDTRYMGKVSPDGLAVDEITLSSSFPTIRFAGVIGMGHYVQGGRFTEPGFLFPSWSQPVVTIDEPCVECFTNHYSLAVIGSRVSP